MYAYDPNPTLPQAAGFIGRILHQNPSAFKFCVKIQIRHKVESDLYKP